MKKISPTTIREINTVSPDVLANKGVIKRVYIGEHAKTNEYICPICANGTHDNGSGIKPHETNSHVGWYCWRCREKFNNLGLLAIHFGLNPRSDFVELVEKSCALLGITPKYETAEIKWHNKRKSNTPTNPPVKAEPVNSAELDYIRADLATDSEPLIKFVDEQGGSWRGLPKGFLLQYGCRFIPKWTSPSSRAADRYSTPTPRLIVPCGSESYLARLTCRLDAFDEKTRQFVKEKQHAGHKILFNADALNSDEPIFALEGYLDALSCEFAGFRAVALGGVNGGQLLVDAARNMQDKPFVIILLDADDSGRKAAPELRDELLSIGTPAVVRFLSDDVTKLDCNEILTNQGVDELRRHLQEIYDDSLGELAACAAAIEDRRAGLSDDDLNFIFSDDSSDLSFARRLERFCGNRVRWLKDDERWLTFSDGLWQRRSEKNSVLARHGQRLADVMIQNAANDDELKLANAFCSSRKVSYAVTMLKGCDSILITADDLDRHSELLNVLNGVIDLQTGKLYPHDDSLLTAKFLITSQCRAIYNPHATSELVDNFFKAIQPDETTRRGLLRWLGYCLTGETCEEKFLIWHGGGGNGKGVLGATMIELTGGYTCGLPTSALLKSSRPVDGDRATLGLNGLEGARFALSEELPITAELDVSLLKNLTGGDRINLRRNYCEFRTIKPTAKVNISGNYLPRLENVDDNGLLRRLLNMPFTQTFGTAERPADRNLKKKILLPENLSAFLGILVREAVAWYRGDDGGLIISDLMRQETSRHLAQNDFISDFIAEHYIRGEKIFVRAQIFIDDLQRAYPRETSRFKRADLITAIERVGRVEYCEDRHRFKIFRGIGKLAVDVDGEPIRDDDVPFD